MSDISPQQRPTIRDVAVVAGISHATVSRYLNKRSYVSEEAGLAIERAISQISYVPNRTARSLVSRKTFSAAFIVREHTDLFFSDPNLSAMAIGANVTFSNAGYQMPILIVESEASARRAIELVAGGSVDGAILMAMQTNDPIALALAKGGAPIVTASSPLVDSSIPSVDTDNVGGSRRISELLVATGRRTIAEIRGPVDAPVSAMRHEGFTTALAGLFSVELSVAAKDWTTEAGAIAMRALLEMRPDIDGVVAAADSLAAGAMDALRARGRRVPEDVGIVGFDSSSWAIRTVPQLSTVEQDTRLTGIRMAELLLAQINGEDLRGHHEIIANAVVWRESAGPLPTRP